MTRANGHDCPVIILRVAGELLHTKRNAASVVHRLLRAVGVFATVHCTAFATTIFTNTRIAKRHVFHVHRELECRGKRRETDADAFTRAAPDKILGSESREPQHQERQRKSAKPASATLVRKLENREPWTEVCSDWFF